jgi:hypothetical protein
LRFSLTQDEKKVDFRWKVDTDGERILEAEIDHSPVNVSNILTD